MGNRLETPDIMSSLMLGPDKQGGNRKQKSGKRKQVGKSSNKAVLKQRSPNKMDKEEITIGEPKEKATFNLSIKTLRNLEDKWIEIRRLSGSRRVSKTFIVEKAIEMALAEFDLKEQRSNFYCKLVSNNKSTSFF